MDKTLQVCYNKEVVDNTTKYEGNMREKRV